MCCVTCSSNAGSGLPEISDSGILALALVPVRRAIEAAGNIAPAKV